MGNIVVHKIVIFLVIVLLQLQGTDPACAIIKVGIYDNEPLVFVGTDGHGKGIFPEIIQWIAGEEGWDIAYVPGTFRENIERLEKEEIDLLCTVAFPKQQNTSMIETIDRHLVVMESSHESVYFKALEKWLEVPASRSAIPGWLQMIFWVSLGLLIFFFIGSLVLRTQVKRKTRALSLELNERQKAEKNLRTTLLSIGDGVIATDEKGRITVMNPVAETLTGWNISEVKGRAVTLIFTIVNAKTGAPALNPVEQVLESGLVVGLVNHTTLISKNGNRYQIADSAAPIQDSLGKIAGVVMVFRDVTEAYQLREAVKERERRYRTIFEKSNDAIFLVKKRTGRYLDANKAGEILTGVSRQQLKKLTTKDVCPDEADERLDKVSGTWPRTALGEIVYVRPDGEKRTAVLTSVPLDEETLIGIARDITTEKAMEKQIRHSQKMEAIGALAGGIAHDFNNILSVIFGHAQLAEMAIHEPEKAKENLLNIVNATKRAAALVQQILTFGRKSDREKHYLNLYIVVKEVVKLIRSTIPATIEIKEEIHSKAAVFADPIQMHQVVMNLCTNAYHAMGNCVGVLTVQLEETVITEPRIMFGQYMNPGHYLELTISDTGHGIDAKILEKIFEPYFTTKEREKGTGLGLAMVLAIVDEHQGYLSVSSKEGAGATFRIYLPVAQKPPQKKNIKPKDALQEYEGTESILLVDDEADIRFAIQKILENYGYKVATAEDALQGYQKFSNAPGAFDLVITDMAMPKMTGDKLAANILKIRKDMPIILCTGYNEMLNEEQAIKMGIRRYIQKPIRGRDLGLLIRELLDEKI